MRKIAIIPVDQANDFIVFQKTVKHEVDLNSLEPILFVKLHDLLQHNHQDSHALIWGISSGIRSSEANKWSKISLDDIAFFVRDNQFLGFAEVKTKFQSENVARELWPELQNEENRQYLLSLGKFVQIDQQKSRSLENFFRKGKLRLDSFQVIDNRFSSEILRIIELQNPADSVGSSAQGFGLTSDEKKIVEMHAVKLASEYLLKSGYTHVEDVGDRESFDLLAHSADKQLSVEVKGSTGSAASVILTRNEVHFQMDAYPLNGLFVVRNIELVKGKTVSARGGDLQFISPWLIDENMLKPLSYDYQIGDSNKEKFDLQHIFP